MVKNQLPRTAQRFKIMNIEIKILNKEFYTDGSGTAGNNCKGIWLPSYATPGSAAIDLVCTKDIIICPGECEMIPTGLAIHIGSDFEKNSYFRVAGLII